MSKLLRRKDPKKEEEEIKALIDDMLVNGTGGDRTKWKRAFKFLVKNKKLMRKIQKKDENIAFEQYYLLGEDRSLAKLCREYGWDLQKVVRWRNEFGWESRVAERDELVGLAIQRTAVASIVNVKVQYSSVINKCVRDMVRNMEEYNRKVAEVNRRAKNPKDLIPYKNLIYNAEDLERLVKLDMLLRGDVTERKEVIGVGTEIIREQLDRDEQTRELLKGLYYRTKSFASGNKYLPESPNGNGGGGNDEKVYVLPSEMYNGVDGG